MEATVRTDPTRSRFSEAPWLDLLGDNHPAIVVGSGGIGSWATLCLARIGSRVYLSDADLVEVHNLGGQMLRATAIGTPKALEVSSMCASLCGGEATVIPVIEMFDSSSVTSPIMISAVDNMKTRKLMFEKWLENHGDDEGAIFIDGRLLAEDYQVYIVTPWRADLYRETLFNDNEVSKENCSLKATTHCSLGIASDMIGALTNWAANYISHKDGKPSVRDVPFSIVKSIPNFLYDVTFVDDERLKEARNGNPRTISTPIELP